MKRSGFYILLLSFAALIEISSTPDAYGAVGDFAYKIGTNYTLNNPIHIAVDGSDNFYVVNHGTTPVVTVFDSSGNYIRGWGARYGNGDGQFYVPQGIAVDSISGNVYVIDGDDRSVQVFDSTGTFLRRWGSYGTDDDQFSYPYRIAIDGSGNVYVTDYGDKSIKVFDPTGGFIRKWGSSGTGDSQFLNGPSGIAIDGSGNVYVTDNFNPRVQVFDSNGNFIFKWGSSGTGDGQFSKSVADIAVDGSGNVYVTDTSNNRIQVFDSNGNFIRKWGNNGTGAGQFTSPQGIAVDGSSNVIVADYGNRRVQIFDSTGNLFWNSDVGDLDVPSGVAVDENGNTYVVDRSKHRIVVFDPSGNFLWKWGGYSYPVTDGKFYYPWGIDVDAASGNVYVVDNGNNRIQVFDSSGNFITKFGSYGSTDGKFIYPTGITVDGIGSVYIADTGNKRIQVFDSSGNFLWKISNSGNFSFNFKSPMGIAVDGSGNIYVADRSKGKIIVFDPSGAYMTMLGNYYYDGPGPGGLYQPYDVAVDEVGNTYVADSGNNRVVVFNPLGGYYGSLIAMWGSQGLGNGQFHRPQGIAIDGVGNIYVADTSNDRIQVFNGGDFSSDTSPPYLSMPSNITVEAVDSLGAIVLYGMPTATDDTDSNPTVSCTPLSGSTFGLGTTSVTCTATDSSNNSSSVSFNVTVQDTTAPALSTPSDIIAEAVDASGAPVSYAAPVASDSIDPSPVVSCTPLSGSTFGLGTTSVTCTATDSSNNSSSVSFNVTVQDTTAPALLTPSNIIVEAVNASGAPVSYTAPVASDSIDPSPVVSCAPSSGSTFGLGTTSVTCTATDSSSNSSSVSFNVTVQDTTAPALSTPSDIIAEAVNASGAPVSYTAPVASDSIDPSPVVSCTPLSGSTFGLGTTGVTCTATDSSNNSLSVSFNVTVQDTTAPALSTPSDIIAEAVNASGAPVSYAAPVASDSVDPSPVVSCTPSSGSTFGLGTTSVTCTATDASNNSSSVSFSVTVLDTIAPTLLTPVDVTAEATSALGATVSYSSATVSDTVDPSPTVVYSQALGTTFPLGITTVTVTATDASGNSSTASFNVSVQDTTPPSVTPSSDITVEATGPLTSVLLGTATATDIVDGPLTPISDQTGPFTLGVHTIVWSATDVAGNTGSASQTVTIIDTRAPTASNVLVTPNPAEVNTAVFLTALIDDSTTGGSVITSAAYSIDGGSFIPMTAEDGVFNTATENVEATIDAFSIAGVHRICVQGIDAAGNFSEEECTLLAVYDPEGGFVTGGGWIESPAGAYVTDVTLTGKANFGFVSKYLVGAQTPDGETEFQFKAGRLNFHSSSYEYLVMIVAGAKAIFKGEGTINGEGNYGFIIKALDEKLTPSQNDDLFRIKIWDKDNGDAVVYDNEIGSDENEDPTTAIGGGSIVIHKP